MKYTALALILGGNGAACFAGYVYANGGPGGSTSLASPVLLLGLAAALVIAGMAMWVFGGKGYAVSVPLPPAPPGTPASPRTRRRPTWSGWRPIA